MSRPAGTLHHPVNHHSLAIYKGSSWPCLFAGCFWYLLKGMPLVALVAFLIGFCTLGFSWLVFPFLANGQHRDHLLRQGYLTREQVDARAVALT